MTVAARCPVAGIVAAYRRSHLQVIWLLLDGMATAEVSRVTGFGVRWIEKLIHRWNGAGGFVTNSISSLITPNGTNCQAATQAAMRHAVKA